MLQMRWASILEPRGERYGPMPISYRRMCGVDVVSLFRRRKGMMEMPKMIARLNAAGIIKALCDTPWKDMTQMDIIKRRECNAMRS